ncbi:hypothetical protein GGP72_002939 [Salinibacter ruber]|uniref:Calx-beta domain-containing protein n=1 Tax=Salinibacter ruber TaxID=146919 RepID=A0A9X2Q1F9_9BACT|nr:Calx-beta domain-containing protein [Salinibacter ruber]MCS3678714.1 hypothetical protein [Salinibacter ruber]MCS3682279.1 hypothetical protein [Salinibacter ruber]
MPQIAHRLLLPACALALLVFIGACDSSNMSTETGVRFSESSYQVSESSDGLDIEVRLERAASETVTVPLTIGGSAIAGVDYQEPESSEVIIEEGENTGSFTVTPIDNASLDSQERRINLSIDTEELDGYAGGETTSAKVRILDDEMAGSYSVSFEEESYTTNEYNENTVDVAVSVSQAPPQNLVLGIETGGSVSQENYKLLSDSVRIAMGDTRDTLRVAINDTRSYGESESLTLRLLEPENEATTISGITETEIEIVNPVADVATFAPDERFALLYTYNTFRDVAVPETGRLNMEDSAPVKFDESFAFPIYPHRDDASVDPNIFGFGSPLWSQDDPKNTNILNMVAFYSGGGPNTVEANVSSGSAGLYYPRFFRLTPDAPGSKTGTVTLVQDEVRVFQKDGGSFVVGISGGGTYDEEERTINVTITFDETAVNNGTVTRRFELSKRRPSN